MARLKLPYATSDILDAATPQQREIVFDTTNDRARVGDGATVGGNVLAFRTEPALVFASGDATPSVANGHQFITAGSTAITNLDDGTANQVVTIHRGDSDIAITDNSNFTLIVAGDITLSASRASVSFRYTGSVWQEVSDGGLTNVPSALTAALAALDLGASLTDVIEAVTIDSYGDARWASLSENNTFEGTQTAPSFTATEADNNATLRALRTGTTTVDARVRGQSRRSSEAGRTTKLKLSSTALLLQQSQPPGYGRSMALSRDQTLRQRSAGRTLRFVPCGQAAVMAASLRRRRASRLADTGPIPF